MGKPRRKSTPSKSRIAEFWLKDYLEDKELEEIKKSPFLIKLCLQDWNEPSCWACGRWDLSKWNQEPASGPDPWPIWNKVKFLQVCHIVPHALTENDELSNLLLLCKDCHSEFCNINSPKHMKLMVGNKESWFKKEYEKGCELMKLFNVSNEQAASVMDGFGKFSEEFTDWVEENTVSVANGKNISTYIAAISEYCELHMNSQDAEVL